MITKDAHTDKRDASAERSWYAALELEQTLETYRSVQRMYVQLLVVLVIANVTIIGLAFQARSGGALLAASILPLLYLNLRHATGKTMVPLVFRAIALEMVYGEDESRGGLVSDFVARYYGVEYLTGLRKIAVLEDPQERYTGLRHMPPASSGHEVRGDIVAVLMFLGQVALAILLTYYRTDWILF